MELDPITLKDHPEISGGSCIGIKYDKGVLLAGDRMLIYAGVYWEKDVQRIHQISDSTILASSGDYADLQKLLKELQNKNDLDVIAEDGHQFLQPKDYCKWLANVHFNKRMRVNPYFNSHIVAGINSQSGDKFLGVVDVYGNTFEGKYIITGLANYFCPAILESGVTDDLTLEGAKALMEKCFRVLYYRDKCQSDMIQYVTMNDQSVVTFEEPIRIESKWDYSFTTNMTNDHTRDMRSKA